MTEIIPGLVSTIIPVYNRPEMVREAVDSVLAQTYRPIEIILVDDGSTDGETPLLLDELAVGQPSVIHVIHQPNAGPGVARETGRQAARGEFIQYLDSDDWLLPPKFEIQVAALNKNPDCDIAYGISSFVDAMGNTVAEPSKWTGMKFDFLFPALLIDRFWHTQTPLYRRRISDSAGPWPHRRPEDWDLEARMGAMNAKLIHCPVLLSCQRSHQASERFHKSERLQYWLDEAWFLPRLYENAVSAGVRNDAPEMQHLAKWMFMRARYLASIGFPKLARDLIHLALDVSNKSWKLKGFLFISSIIGMKNTARIAFLLGRKSTT